MRPDHPVVPVEDTSQPLAPSAPSTEASAKPVDAALEAAVNYVLSDCFFAVGQVVAGRKNVDHAAIMWWRDHFRARFLGTMQRSGNTWLTDRGRVLGVGRLLADRAVRYAGDRPSIDLECAMKAADDVEAYCARRVETRRRRLGLAPDTPSTTLYAGWWCMPWYPTPENPEPPKDPG